MAAITASDLQWRLSVKTGSAGNTTSSAPAGSLGKYISTTAWSGGSANDLFDDISAVENAASTIDYRCVFVYNANSANDLTSATVFLQAEVAGGASIAIALDSIAASVLGASAAQGQTATTETAPGAGVTGLSFSSPTSAGAGLLLGTLSHGSVRAIWVRRTASNTTALASDGVTLAISGSTGSA